MRLLVLLLIILYTFMPSSANASSAGGACSTSGMVETDSGQTLICNGTAWVLVSNTLTSGSVGIGTASPAAPLTVAPPASETIAAAATVTANGCSTIKPVTSTAARATSTTDAFTNATTAGCCMTVFNVGTFTITLKRSSNFLTTTGADLSLTAGSMVPVCSYGSKWYQVSALVTPS